MLQEIKNIDNSKTALRKFGITMGIVLLLIASYLYVINYGSFTIFAVIGLSFVLTGYLVPQALKYLNIAWMSIAIVLGHFISGIILVIIFYLLLTPIGLLIKLTKKDLLNLYYKKSEKSYWQPRDVNEKTKEIFEKQF